MALKNIPIFESEDNYVFIPACCYAGNQFRTLKYGYPPMFRPGDADVEMQNTITDVPRLEPDGSGKIEVTTGDAATPCVGVFSKKLKRGILVFTVQQIDGQNIGLAYEKGSITLSWPAKREKIYRMTRTFENPVPWKDLPAEIPYKIIDFCCSSLAEFFRTFFENRKIMGMDSSRPDVMPHERQAVIQVEKFNAMNWDEKLGIYMVGTDRTRFQVWQPGWTGGTLSGYALMRLGGKTEAEREMKTLYFLFSTQGKSGFFEGVIDADGISYGDAFSVEGEDNWHLIRKSADVLYFLFKHFDLMKERNISIPEGFITGAKKTADAFVRLHEKYGQFGHFVDIESGDIIAGGSVSAGIAPAGLARAYTYFGDKKYLVTAEESAERYYREFLSKGFTSGGPGEILQGVDSESAFGLLESFVILYETTHDGKWLDYACECAHYCSSWVVSYNYRFPEGSEFARHGMKTVGSVFANIQNKHSAPGICTLSGDSLLKLWRITKDRLYLELIRDIALTIGQYMSTSEDPIYDWDSNENDKKCPDSPHILPEGFINERVNMSDWEDDRCIGGVFNGSCWSETSNLLTLAEVIPELKKITD
jgi:hypothetical protein